MFDKYRMHGWGCVYMCGVRNCEHVPRWDFGDGDKREGPTHYPLPVTGAIDTEARALIAALQARVDALEARAHTHPGPHDEPPGALVCACGHELAGHLDNGGEPGTCAVVTRGLWCACEKWRPVRREVAK